MSTMDTAVQETVPGRDLVTIGFVGKPGKVTLRTHTKKGRLWKFLDDEGNETAFTLDGTMQFDLNKPFDKKVVEGFRDHPVYAKALVITSRKETAQKVVATYDMVEQAGTIVKKFGKNVSSFARVLGVHVNGLSEVEVKARLLEIALKEPVRIIDMKNDPLYLYRVLLTEGLSAGVFTRREGIYMYGTTSMGSTEPLALDWLQKNSDLIPALQKEVENKLKR